MIKLPHLLSGLSRQIKVHSCNIKILESPANFQNTLLSLSSTVQHRSRVSTLYIGSGKTEREIIANLANAVTCRGAEISTVIDRYRGTRDGGVSLKELRRVGAPIYLYQTPHWKRFRYQKPGQIGEILGVHHMKYYLFDDTVIISGANLSQLYFGPRQDRYFVITSKEFADYVCYFHELYVRCAKEWIPNSISSSYWTDSTRAAAWTTSNTFTCNTPIENDQTRDLGPPDGDTSLFPLFQIPWDNVTQLDDALDLILLRAKAGQNITISSGYFNPTSTLIDAMKFSKAQIELIIPSVEANGFYEGAFVKGFVPDLYNFSALQTLKRCPNIKIIEYNRNNWSYHAKGVWSDNLTVLGSSNFNKRSSLRDTEFSIALITDNDDLKNGLLEERNRLRFYSKPVSVNYRSVARLTLPIVSSFL